MANQTNLLSNQGKRGDSSYTTTGVNQGLDTISVDIEDSAYLSDYFQVVEFNPVFTSGKNSISFNGSDLLAVGSEIKVEVLDSQDNSLYLQSPPKSANFVDVAIFTVSIYVYSEVANGPGKVILVGTTSDGETVRWTGNISINTSYPNVSRTRFYFNPQIEVTPRLIPTIDITAGSSLGVNAVVTGSCTGYSLAATTTTRIPAVTALEIKGKKIVTAIVTPATRTTSPSAANSSISNYRVNWTTLSSSLGIETGFNSSMIGGTITLYVHKAQDPGSPTLNIINSTQSFTIKNVINPSQLQLDGDVVDTLTKYSSLYVSPSFVGSYVINYIQTGYLNQATAVPCFGQYSASNHTTTIITNNSFFSSSMIGTAVQLNFNTLYLGSETSNLYLIPSVSSSYNRVPVTSSVYTILNVENSYTASITPVTYTLYNFSDPHIISTTTYTASRIYGSVTSLSSSTAYQYYSTIQSSSVLLYKSYADVVFRNITTFSGFVATQKLYAKSNIYPGDFELISNTPVSPVELLYDPLTINKNYADIGVFYNQDQVNQYWYASSASFTLVQNDDPVLSSMTITAFPDVTGADGNSYVIAKTSAIGVNNDNNYYPYDPTEYDDFSGTGYTSNFIFLAQNSLYSLSTNISIVKNSNQTANVSFYLTSSSPGISNEPNFSPVYGLLLGQITISDPISTKIFTDVQEMLFTPLNDYFGTLVIVPYLCDVTLSNLSLQNYGDYGFSPDVAEVKIPFPVNVAGEPFTIKAELYDNNSKLVYAISPVIQSFDPNGVSLFGTSVIATVGTGSSAEVVTVVPYLTVEENLYLPGIPSISPPMRFLAFEPSNGQVGYTPVSNLTLVPTNTNVSSFDYINLEINGNTVGRSLVIRYSGSAPNVFGRRVYVDPNGIKTTYM